MKRQILILLLIVLTAAASAAPVYNMPAIRIQPNSDTLRCWVSGDEFFHRLHDAEGYTIVQDVQTGQYVYATLEKGLLVPTAYVPGRVNPAQMGLRPHLMPSKEELSRLHHLWDIPEEYRLPEPKTSGINHGTLNNVVVFIRFHDDSVCMDNSFATVNAMFNDSTPGAVSMYNYFKTASYNNIRIPTVFCPQPADTVVLSYQDGFDRSYYTPYSATNPNGYQDHDQRRSREMTLLTNAVNWVNANCPVDSSLNLDMDGDGNVDNICFVVSGTYTAWNDLLWPHKWSLYQDWVYINGKRVYNYNFQLAGSGSHYFSVSTFCHEMSHTLGCPDLYHYNNYTDVTPAGSWDLMCSNQTPPQQTNALFKLIYLNWFDSIPEIKDSGRYSLQSLGTGPNHACKIAAQAPHQWYILEYRNIADTFDSSLPNRGMLIWRYNDSPIARNSNFNNADTVHELWLFRPDSHNDTMVGQVSAAAFGLEGRNTFSAVCGNVATASNPYPYLCNGQADTSFSLTDIEVSDDQQTVSFTFTPYPIECEAVTHFPETMDFEFGNTRCWTFVSASAANAAGAHVCSAERIGGIYFIPHMGEYQFRFCGLNYAPDYNQYLISPQLQPANPLHMVFYYSKTSFASEHFKVKYSTTGNDTADFTETLADVTVNTSDWHCCDLLIPETAKYVAINYCSRFKYYLYIDDITLSDTLQNAVIRDTTYIHLTDTVYYNIQDTVSVTVYDTLFTSPDYYQVLVYPNFPERGLVSGNGIFPRGTQLEIAAMAKAGYSFEGWTDGNRDNPRRLLVDSELLVGAIFVPEGIAQPERTKTTYVHDTIYIRDTLWLPTAIHDTVVNYVHQPFYVDTTTYYTLTVLSDDTAKGIAAGSGRFPKGATVELGALARPGFRLWHWEDLSHDNPRKVTVTDNMTLKAYFINEGAEGIAPVDQSGVKIYAQGNAIVVEAPAGERLTVYNVLGQQVYQTAAVGGVARVASLRQGLYLVKVGSRAAQRVVVLGSEL